MPMNKSLYPKNWKEIALKIKNAADWHCVGCGRPCRRPGEAIDDLEVRVGGWPDAVETVESECGNIERFVLGRFTLTVAHLDHQPANCRAENLRAWCAPCHCRYDLNAIRSGAKTAAALERAGQLSLLTLLE